MVIECCCPVFAVCCLLAFVVDAVFLMFLVVGRRVDFGHVIDKSLYEISQENEFDRLVLFHST